MKGSLSMCNKSSVISEEEVSDQLLLGLCVGLKSPEIEDYTKNEQIQQNSLKLTITQTHRYHGYFLQVERERNPLTKKLRTRVTYI